MASAYLIAIFEQEPAGLRFLRAGIFSEWPVSQMFGPGCKVQALITSAEGWRDFEAARGALCDAIKAQPMLAWARNLPDCGYSSTRSVAGHTGGDVR